MSQTHAKHMGHITACIGELGRHLRADGATIGYMETKGMGAPDLEGAVPTERSSAATKRGLGNTVFTDRPHFLACGVVHETRIAEMKGGRLAPAPFARLPRKVRGIHQDGFPPHAIPRGCRRVLPPVKNRIGPIAGCPEPGSAGAVRISGRRHFDGAPLAA